MYGTYINQIIEQQDVYIPMGYDPSKWYNPISEQYDTIIQRCDPQNYDNKQPNYVVKKPKKKKTKKQKYWEKVNDAPWKAIKKIVES